MRERTISRFVLAITKMKQVKAEAAGSPSLRKRIARAVRGGLASYAQASAWLVLRVQRPTIVGITGTVGKTTTLRMLQAILDQEAVARRLGPVKATTSNMNDAWGVPLTVLGLRSYYSGPLWRQLRRWAVLPLRAMRLALDPGYPRLLILEYGAGNRGHLHRLTRLARPDVGVITSVGAGHLGRLGDVHGVMEEKSALASAPPSNGAVVLGAGHAFVKHLAERARAPVTIVEGEGLELNRNIAAEVARLLGVSEPEIEAGLQLFRNETRRLERKRLNDLTVIDDTHNANPQSMSLALATLSRSDHARRKVAVLGPMAELGPESRRLHAEVGSIARQCADVVVGVGAEAQAYEPDLWYPDVDSCGGKIGEQLKPGDCVLFKASNSSQLWRAIDELAARKESERVQ